MLSVNVQGSDYAAKVCSKAEELLDKEVKMNDAMAKFGASLVKDGDGILTHCNTGSLATPGKGIHSQLRSYITTIHSLLLPIISYHYYNNAFI
jgi:methylthioribose-1-phosphate isomerase